MGVVRCEFALVKCNYTVELYGAQETRKTTNVSVLAYGYFVYFTAVSLFLSSADCRKTDSSGDGENQITQAPASPPVRAGVWPKTSLDTGVPFQSGSQRTLEPQETGWQPQMRFQFQVVPAPDIIATAHDLTPPDSSVVCMSLPGNPMVWL
uniref:Uncharacterized protein n=1 Tax=Oncorhynchus tshawytscha TaxID=74940 RepID=A0AAZ3S3L7_ONCTS